MDKCRYGLEVVEWQRKQQEERPHQERTRVQVPPGEGVARAVQQRLHPIPDDSTADMLGSLSLVEKSFLATAPRPSQWGLQAPTTSPSLRLPEVPKPPGELIGEQHAFEPLAISEDLIFDESDAYYLAELFTPPTSHWIPFHSEVLYILDIMLHPCIHTTYIVCIPISLVIIRIWMLQKEIPYRM